MILTILPFTIVYNIFIKIKANNFKNKINSKSNFLDNSNSQNNFPQNYKHTNHIVEQKINISQSNNFKDNSINKIFVEQQNNNHHINNHFSNPTNINNNFSGSCKSTDTIDCLNKYDKFLNNFDKNLEKNINNQPIQRQEMNINNFQNNFVAYNFNEKFFLQKKNKFEGNQDKNNLDIFPPVNNYNFKKSEELNLETQYTTKSESSSINLISLNKLKNNNNLRDLTEITIDNNIIENVSNQITREIIDLTNQGSNNLKDLYFEDFIHKEDLNENQNYNNNFFPYKNLKKQKPKNFL